MSYLYEIMRANIVQQYRPQMTIWCMRIACWIPKVTDTLSQYVILLLFNGNNGFAKVPQYVHTYIACVFFPHFKLCTTSHARAETARHQ
jgi:hypothetical protein